MKRTTFLLVILALFAVMGGMIYVAMQNGGSEPDPPLSETGYSLNEYSVIDELYIDGKKIEKSIEYVSYDYPNGIPGVPFVDSDYVWVQLTYTIDCINAVKDLPKIHTAGYINVTNFEDDYSRIAVRSDWSSMTEHPGSEYQGQVVLNYLIPVIVDGHMLPIPNDEVTLEDLDLRYPHGWREMVKES